MSGRDDRRVHDFLDGRLSEAERREFELRMEDDPDLARVAEAYREQGRALRAGDEELPERFYARARSRFEETGRRRVGWPRHLLSWEALGLAAAAILVGVLFLPWRRPVEPTPPRVAEEAAPEKRELAAPERAERGSRPGSDAEPSAPSAAETPPAAQPHPTRSFLREKSRAETDASGPSDPGRAVAAAPAPALAVESDDATAGAEARQTAFVVGLSRDLSGPDGLREVTDPARWAGLLRDEPTLAALRAPRPGWRLVLVGGDGLDCTGMTVIHGADAYEIELRRGGASRGCALVLPRDGKPVRRIG